MVAMIAARETEADALLVSAPATYGPSVLPDGRKNQNFGLNRSEFLPIAGAVRIPTVMFLFKDDPFESSGRAEHLTQSLDRKGIAHLIIDRPAGFGGHFAGWQPIFDYAFGKCIARFLDAPAKFACEPEPLGQDDMRAIIHVDQVPKEAAKELGDTADLAGSRYVRYSRPLAEAEFTSAAKIRLIEAVKERTPAVTVKNKLLCVETTCNRYFRWKDGSLLEFDAKSGNLAALWIKQ